MYTYILSQCLYFMSLFNYRTVLHHLVLKQLLHDVQLATSIKNCKALKLVKEEKIIIIK
jgi:hypothetical protein